MVYTYPDYYKGFKCTAGDCSDTCCSGWQIVIDKNSLKKYKRLQKAYEAGKFGINMKDYVDFKEGVFKQQDDRRCAFLMDDNLCLLCKECGEEAFCRTCDLYPRHIEEFENVREIMLSLSCPEVAKVVLTRTAPAVFVTEDRDIEEDEEYNDFDFLLYSTLCDMRETCLKILQNRSIPIDTRAGIVLGLAHDIDKKLNDGTFFSTEELLEYALTDDAAAKSTEKVNAFLADKAAVYDFMQKKFKKLFSLEPISYSWIDLYTEAEYLLYRKGADHYTKWSERFDKYMAEKNMSFDIQLEQILVYFIFTYLCGAVYDSRIYGKGKLCVFSAYYIREFLKAAFIKNDGTLSEDEIQDIVIRYSRELEHSDENLNRMEEF